MAMDQRSLHKTDRADQTVSRRDLKLGGMVELTPPTTGRRLAPIGLMGRYREQKYENAHNSCLILLESLAHARKTHRI